MASLEKITYQEDPDTLSWIDTLANRLGAHKGREVSRAEVVRWLTRNGRDRYGNLSISTISAQV